MLDEGGCEDRAWRRHGDRADFPGPGNAVPSLWSPRRSPRNRRLLAPREQDSLLEIQCSSSPSQPTLLSFQPRSLLNSSLRLKLQESAHFHSMVVSASMKNQAKPLIIVTTAAKSNA